MNKKIIADIYIRLSSKSQEDGMSRETQENECRKYCEANGITVRNVYYENKSAMTPYDRPVFYKMIANQQSKDKADVIISFCINRLTRNQYDFYPIEVLVDKFDTKIIFVKENMTISKPFKSHEKFLTSILIASAEFEVKHMNEIRKKGLMERAKTGIRPSRVPFGYRMKNKRIVIIPKEAEIVRKVYELYSTNEYSLNTLSEKLFELGYEYKLQKSKKIQKATLSRILKNKFYTGFFDFPDIETPIKGKYKPIVSQELFNKVQNVLKTSANEKQQKHCFLYSSLLRLQETGKIMTGEIKKGRYIYYTAFDKVDKSKVRKNFDFLYPGIVKCGVCGYSFCGERQKKHNIYYRCSHFDRSCPNTCYISEKHLTQSFRMHLKRIGLDNDLYELVKYSLKECLGDEQEYHKTEIARITSEIEQCKEILKKMYLDQVNNVLDYDMWINLKNEYEVKLNRLSAEYQKHLYANTNFLDTGLKILDLCRKASFPATELAAEEVANIIRETYLSATAKDKRAKVVFKEPFATIENLVKLAKREIAEVGFAEFKSTIISSKDKCLESIKKEPLGSDFNCSSCFKWWTLRVKTRTF